MSTTRLAEQAWQAAAPPDAIPWPRKERELQDRYFDSTIWNDLRFRAGDVVIASYAKAGTTWLQQIVAQLIFGGRDDIDVAALSPWLDMRLRPREETLALLETQQHRRFIKTHLPVDALRFSSKVKYLYVARDGRDIAWSLHNHLINHTEDFYRHINEPPDRLGPLVSPPPVSVVQFFREWLSGDGYPIWPFWDHVLSWWQIRRLPNVLLMHFADLKRDISGEIRRIADFLEIPADEELLARVIGHSSFDHMKANAARYAPMNGAVWQGGATTFIHKGTNGRWRDALGARERRQYEQVAEERLGPVCAHWLAHGRLASDGREP